MKIQYASDLHMEFYDNSVFLSRGPFKVAGDVLVLAGDTFPLKEFDAYAQHRFFDWCADNFRETLLVPGNHEYYGDNLARYDISWELKIRDNVTMYQNRSVVIDDAEFILSTMWSNIPAKDSFKVRKGMSDFTLIRAALMPLSPTIYNAVHKRDLAFIKKAVAESKAEKKVVVTHHTPSRLLVAPEFQGSILECGFTVDLTDYIETSGIDLWIYGHSHRSIDRLIGHTQVVSNQVGYFFYGENLKNFSGDRYVDLDEEGFVPRNKGDVINLSNGSNGGVFLEKIAPESPWFKLSSDNYTRLVGDSPIEAFEPDGGPCVKIGDRLAGRIVKKILVKEGDILVKLIK